MRALPNVDVTIGTLRRGGVVLREVLSIKEHQEILSVLPWTKLTEADEYPESGNGAVRQQMSEFQLEPKHSSFDYARVLQGVRNRKQREIEELFEGRNLFPTPLHFNKIRIHRYPAGSCGITSHRDGSDNINLIYVIALRGTLHFTLHRERNNKFIKTLVARTRDAVLLSSVGFQRMPYAEVLYHQLARSRSEMITLGFRQKKS